MIDAVIKLLPLYESVRFGGGVDSQVPVVRVELLRARGERERKTAALTFYACRKMHHK